MRGQANLDRQNFGVRHDFSEFFWQIVGTEQFIFAIIIFPEEIMQNNFGTTYEMDLEVTKMLRTSGGKIRNDDQYVAQK